MIFKVSDAKESRPPNSAIRHSRDSSGASGSEKCAQ